MQIKRFKKTLIAKPFSRQKLQTLVAILAIELGKECSRAEITKELWPNSSVEIAKRNLYSIWHFLKKSLSLPDGSCPYIMKFQHGFKFDESFVRSDYHIIKELCDDMNIQNPDIQLASNNLKQIQDIYKGKLLPNENCCRKIVNYRDYIHNKLISTMVAYTTKLLDDYFPTLALEYANHALHLEKDREDVYLALMMAQIACNQKSLAIRTYKTCRKYLIDEIGIDPSPEIVSTYKGLLKHEENF